VTEQERKIASNAGHSSWCSSGDVAAVAPHHEDGRRRARACDVITIRCAIHAGELRALRLGSHGDYRIPIDALEKWLRPAHDPEEAL